MKKPQTETSYVVHCDACSYHAVMTGTPKLIEIKRASIQKSFLNPASKDKPDIISLNKQYKCPKCGRGITLRNCLVKPQKAEEDGKDNNARS